MNDVFILSAARTPIGTFLGVALAPFRASQLGARRDQGRARARRRFPPTAVDQVWMGNVLQAGQGQAPARQAALARRPPEVDGLRHGPQGLRLGHAGGDGRRERPPGGRVRRSAVAGGMESMSNAPYLLPKGRSGLRMGHGQLLDSMISDGLWDPYKNIHMGNCAELCAAKYAFTREAQDAFALESYQRARRANESGDFNAEFAPVTIEGKKGADRRRPRRGAVRDAAREAREDGDAQAGLPEGRHGDRGERLEDQRRRVGARPRRPRRRPGERRKPIARIVAQASHAQEPEWFTTAPVAAARKAAEKAGIPLSADRPLRGERGVRGRRDGVRRGPRSRPEQGERERRRRGARPSDRRLGRAHPRRRSSTPSAPGRRSTASRRSASGAAKRRRSSSRRSDGIGPMIDKVVRGEPRRGRRRRRPSPTSRPARRSSSAASASAASPRTSSARSPARDVDGPHLRLEQLRRGRLGPRDPPREEEDPEDDLVLRRRERRVRAAVPRGRARARVLPAGHARRADARGRGRASPASTRRRASARSSPRARRRRSSTGGSTSSSAASSGDFALVAAWKADRLGNLVYRKTARNFNPMAATAGRITIAEVEELVEPGALDPDEIDTPGIFVKRVVVAPRVKRIERRTVRKG